MTPSLNRMLHLLLSALLLASSPCWAANAKSPPAPGRHHFQAARTASNGQDSSEPASALSSDGSTPWPARGLDALVQSLSLPLDHPASQKALQMLGSTYKWGGTSAEYGMDCSGYVWRSFKDALNVALPRTAREMAARLQKILPHELRAGDLVFFNTRGSRFSHVGIYLGGAMFAHSPRAGSEARIDNLDHPYWLAAFDGARRAPIASTHRPSPDDDAAHTKEIAASLGLAPRASEPAPTAPARAKANEFSYANSAAVAGSLPPALKVLDPQPSPLSSMALRKK